MAELTQQMLKLLDTDHLTTTSYHPQTNGLSERLNQTLEDKLSMYVNMDNHNNLDQVLPFVTFAYNTSRQESTGYTPFYIMYGKEALHPSDLELGVKLNSFEAKRDLDYATRLGQQLKKGKLIVTQRLHQVHLPQKAQYDKG